MGHLLRQNRAIVATGGSCPMLERLSNGDLLVAYRKDTQPRVGMVVTRSTDDGDTWRKEHIFTKGSGADDERILLVDHNQPPPRVCDRDFDGVFCTEQVDDPPANTGLTYAA
ncbi:MAG: hypothetical protein CMJ49_06525 [Planctomycetaceae bacterium]|nr:hypothetical protein [Planctomycetaceae bacterium]